MDKKKVVMSKTRVKTVYLILFFLSALFLNTTAVFATDYILYVRARGELGKELRTYWNAVLKDEDISHHAIRDYPPHCSLTGFFPKKKSSEFYIQAVEDAIQQQGAKPRTITIKGLVQGNQNQKLDYIKLSSSFLFAVAQAFLSNASIPDKYLKKPQSFPYHITLRKHKFLRKVAKKMEKIQSLENKIDLTAQVSWSLFLYEKENKKELKMIKEFPL